jgi:hypothetical protein
MKSKRGVIRIIEAVLAIMILLGVVLLLIQRQPIKVDFSSSVYKVQTQILNEIADNNDYRTAVLSNNRTKIECYIQSRLSRYSLDFNTSICDPKMPWNCVCNAPSSTEVYSVDTLISSNITTYQPTKLMMCSWVGKMTMRDCAVGPVAPVCGDGNCNGAETCSTCPADCGVCLTINCPATSGTATFDLIFENSACKSNAQCSDIYRSLTSTTMTLKSSTAFAKYHSDNNIPCTYIANPTSIGLSKDVATPTVVGQSRFVCLQKPDGITNCTIQITRKTA